MQLIEFQSQVKLVETIKTALKLVNSTLKISSPVKPFRSTPTKINMEIIHLSNDLGENFIKTVRVHMVMFLRQIENANTEATVSNTLMDNENDVDITPGNRYKLKEVIITTILSKKITMNYIHWLYLHFTPVTQGPNGRCRQKLLILTCLINIVFIFSSFYTADYTFTTSVA